MVAIPGDDTVGGADHHHHIPQCDSSSDAVDEYNDADFYYSESQ